MTISKQDAPPIVEAIGYHGTRLEFAENIMLEDFRPSGNEWEWLGHGVYFWQDAPARARSWARAWHQRKGYQGPIAVVAAKIQLLDFVDLLDQVGMHLVRTLAIEFQLRRSETDKLLSNVYPRHKLDCELFNFITSVLDLDGIIVRGYRAACVEGAAITENSPIFDQSHVQISVIDQSAILKKWIVEDEEAEDEADE